jgi:hypothetical protein
MEAVENNSGRGDCIPSRAMSRQTALSGGSNSELTQSRGRKRPGNRRRAQTRAHPRSSLLVVTGRAARCNPTRHGQVEKGQEEDRASCCRTTCSCADARAQVIRPWCWYCEREFEDEKGGCAPCARGAQRLTRRTHSADAAPKGEALQVRDVPAPAEHRRRPRGAHPAGPQARR